MKSAFSILFAVLFLLAEIPAVADEPEEQWPSYGIMNWEAHKSYFRQGAYSYYMPSYDVYGQFTYTQIDYTEDGGTFLRSSEYSAFEVSENIIPSRGLPYMKEVYDDQDELKWQPGNNSFVYEFTDEEFDAGYSGEIWLSNDRFIKLTKDDVRVGTPSEFYDEAIEATEGACCLTDEEHRFITVGTNTEQCFFVEHKQYDVLCHFRNLNSGYVNRVYYVRMQDAIG